MKLPEPQIVDVAGNPVKMTFTSEGLAIKVVCEFHPIYATTDTAPKAQGNG